MRPSDLMVGDRIMVTTDRQPMARIPIGSLGTVAERPSNARDNEFYAKFDYNGYSHFVYYRGAKVMRRK